LFESCKHESCQSSTLSLGLKARGDKLPGYAIGGLAGGEEKSAFCRVVSQCTAALPTNKPRYVMGVGYPLDLVVGHKNHLVSALNFAETFDQLACIYVLLP